MKIQYIYFEVNRVTGENATEPVLENVNGLILKPHTNSSGVWGFTNLTERPPPPKTDRKSSYAYVLQFWVDLDKYKFGHERSKELDKNIAEAVDIITKNLK